MYRCVPLPSQDMYRVLARAGRAVGEHMRTLQSSVAHPTHTHQATLMASTSILFAAGVAFAYFIVCPIIFKFFIASAPNSIQVMTDISQYLNFVIKLVFAFGIAFEIPIATFLLIKSGIMKKDALVNSRPYLVILFFVMGMLLTPPDIFSQLFLAIPMWILFELGLLISRDKS